MSAEVNENVQVTALRTLIAEAICEWNAAHPQRLPSHRERSALNITATFTDGKETPNYTNSIECKLAGRAALNFHGHDLAQVAEHARLTVERRLIAEIQLREANAREDADFVRKYGQAS
jgi:hypothetical protein